MKLFAIGVPARFDTYLGVEVRYVMSDWQQLYESEEDVVEAASGQGVKVKAIPYEGEYYTVDLDGSKAYTWDLNYANYLAERHGGIVEDGVKTLRNS